MRDTIEERMIDYILGDAMMEPDVRIKMNEAGFCHEHFAKLRGMKNKLALALILESHLADVNSLLETEGSGRKGFFKKKEPDADAGDKLSALSGSCFRIFFR